jgi:hypothetical protein
LDAGTRKEFKGGRMGVFIFPMLGVFVWGKGKSLGGAGDFEGICKGIAHPLKPLGSLVSLNY